MSAMQENRKAYARVIAHAWRDPAYLERLKKDPAGVLSEAGVEHHGKVHVHVGDDHVTHFVLPLRPSHLTDDDLDPSDPHPDMCCHLAG